MDPLDEARYRFAIIAGVSQGVLYDVRLCSTCGRHYATLAGDARGLMCCDREARAIPPTAVECGTLFYFPNADQFVEEPAVVVEGKPA